MTDRSPYTFAGVARRQWVFCLTVVATALCIGVGALGYTRPAGYLLAAVLWAVGLLRLFVDPEHLGGLVVRSRAVDVSCVLVMGTALAVLAAVTPNLA